MPMSCPASRWNKGVDARRWQDCRWTVELLKTVRQFHWHSTEEEKRLNSDRERTAKEEIPSHKKSSSGQAY